MRATITASKRHSLITMTLLLAPLGACSDPSGSAGPGTEPDPGAGGSGGQVTSSGGISSGGGIASGGGSAGASAGGGSGGDVVEEPTYPMVEARNPNIWADVPDMAILRVGSTYYMSSTTMHMNPGVPIMRSEDLVNWEVVSYAHQALDANHPRLNMSNGQSAYGQGSWASSIRYHQDTYFVSTFSNTTGKTYVYRTKDIENGPWQTNVIDAHLHDSSLFFDDGKAYFIYGVDDIRIIELNPEATAIKQGGLNQILIPKSSSIAGTQFYVTAEGAQVQKINDWYYVNLISWPAGSGRTQLLYRSRNLTGPYEGRVVLSDNTAQGSLIDTPEGDWYAYLFRDSGAVGRIPYLVPVRWEDDWPVLGVEGRVPETLGFQVEDRGLIGIIRSDEFDDDDLDLVWQWNHNPDPTGWSLTDRPGFLRITNTRVDATLVATRNTLTQRMFGPTCSGSVEIELSGMKDGDYAGIAAFQDKYGFVGVTQSGGQRAIVMVNASSGTPQEIERVDIDQDRVSLRVTGDFRNRTDKAEFHYSLDGVEWTRIGGTLQMEYLLTHFMGYRFALFNFGTLASGGYVDFDSFHVEE